LKVYVGATFSRYLEARSVIDALTAAGHTVTHDWTRTDAFGPDGHLLPDTGGGYDIDPDEQRRHAEDDRLAVEEAELLLILAQQASCSWPIEVGMALALRRAAVWIVEPFKPTVFWHLPGVRIFDDVAEPLRALGATP
jgi:hypothetical protein